MARPREFDEETVLTRALEAFWERGYKATSMADLIAVTGLQKGSLYKAFGSKEELFLRALDRYLSGYYETVRTQLEAHASARQGLREWLKSIVAECNDDETRRGCLAVNSLVELGPDEGAAATRLRDHFARIEKLLSRSIAHGQAQGEFSSPKPANELGEVLFLIAKGMLASAKGAHSKAQMQRFADFALETLG